MSNCTCLPTRYERVAGVNTLVPERNDPDCPEHGTEAIRKAVADARKHEVSVLERLLRQRVQGAIDNEERERGRGKVSNDIRAQVAIEELIRAIAELQFDTRRGL